MRSLLLLLVLLPALVSGQTRLILDADTANEVDDPFAIIRLLLDPAVEVTALNATQWEASHYRVPQTMMMSQRMNNALLAYLEIDDVPSLKGGTDRMYDWGDLAQPSAASNNIIRQAQALPEGERLTIIALGALTNVGSAIVQEPAIADRIDLYWLGSQYDFTERIMTKRDFNVVMDIQALEEVLNSNINLHVLPVSEANALTFTREEVAEHLPPDHPVTGFLLRLWDDHVDGGRLERVLWDIGIVEAFLRPGLFTAEEVPLPRANGSRMVTYFRDIDVPVLKEDYWRAVVEGLRD
jgi:inosine-uridine nucleoside N-ribohydrolase